MNVVERHDGFFDAMDATIYFLEPDAWPGNDVAGRILDIGAGAGRHSLALQSRGHKPVALDISPSAIETLEKEEPEPFHAAMLLGNNLGLLESAEQSNAMWEALRRLVCPDGAIVGTCLDPYLTDDPVRLTYHQWNRNRGRLSGQPRLRVRYRDMVDDRFDWLFRWPDEPAAMAGRPG
jgi:SAM-dependent methyltransferase